MDRTRRDFLSTTALAATLGAASPLLANTPLAPAEPGEPQAPTPARASYDAPTEIKKPEFYNLRELEGLAQKVIPTGGFGYIASAAGDEWTKRENEIAYKRMTITPRYLSGNDDADMTTTLLGTKISMPIIISVMGGHGLAHITAEAGTAKGADALGTILTVGSSATLPIEDVAKATPGPKWIQLYMPEDPGWAKEFLLRAKAAGYLAVVITIDGTVGTNRETDRRNHFVNPMSGGNRAPAGTNRRMKVNLGWDDIAFAQKVTGLPVLIKGVLSPELAVQAVERGCAGIQVSNHGGRDLDDVPATITVLPRIADAVAGRIPIVVDGGVRRGQDVFKALAQGATAVALGRPILFGLALGGWMGVRAVLEHIRDEFEFTMQLAGAKNVHEITRSYITT